MGGENSREMTPGIYRARCCCVAVAMSSSSAAVVAHDTSRAFARECAELAPPYAFRAFGKFLDRSSDPFFVGFYSVLRVFCLSCLRRIVSRLCGVVFLPNSAAISCAGRHPSHSLPFFSHL